MNEFSRGTPVYITDPKHYPSNVDRNFGMRNLRMVIVKREQFLSIICERPYYDLVLESEYPDYLRSLNERNNYAHVFARKFTTTSAPIDALVRIDDPKMNSKLAINLVRGEE